MQITVRTLLASIIATAVLAGAVGALATAATTSQADPQAIAAAVQKVQDRTAESYLRGINTRTSILNIDSELLQSSAKETASTVKELQATAVEIRKKAFDTCWVSARTSSEANQCLN
jgi:hypothetical protein